MASSDYDSGISGKFRKRPFRRSSATTPYDRPQTAVRRTNPNPNCNGWISKIVDPASRILYRGASKLFFSVFHKRLTAPPPQDQEENHISRHEAPDAVHNSEKPSDEALEPSSNCGDNAASNYGTDETQQETPCTEGFFEFEQMLKQKTFTRAEFDRLTDLLRSRTVESSTSNLQNGNETEEEAVVTEQAKHNQEEPSMPQPAITCEIVENAVNSEHGRMKSLNLRGNISNSAVNLHILEEEAAVPPEEIAKAYMDSRPSKVSPTTLSVQSQLQDDFILPTVSYAKKRATALLDSRSSILFPGSSEHSENGHITPRPRGRSALYKVSRSPYFKLHAVTNSRVGLRVGDGLASSSSSPSPKVLLSTGRQVLKRGSSVLDNDGGSFGPIRRTRQKSLLMSSSQRDSSPCRTTSLSPDAGNGKGTYPFATIGHVPPQSTEMAMKIFRELDKLVLSPSEKLPEKKGSGNCDAASDSPLPILRSSISPKQNIKKNGPSQNAVAAGKFTGEGGDVGNSVTSATIVKSGKEMAATPISFPAATSEKEPDVQMTTVQESVGLDAKHNMGGASGLSIAKSDKLSEKPLSSSSNSISSSSVLKGKTNVEGFDRPATEKGVSSAALSSAFQPSSIPSGPRPPVSEGSPSATLTPAVLEGPGSDGVISTQKGVYMYKSFGSATSSGLSASSVLFNSRASTSPNQNNGFPISAITTSSTTTSSTSSITATESPTPSSPSINPANGIFRFSASEQFSSQSLSSAQNNLSTSNYISSGTVGFEFGAQPTQSAIGTTSALQNSTVQSTSFASVPTFGLNAASSVSSGFSSSSVATTAAAANLFSSSSQPPSMFTSTFGSNPSLPSTGFSFGSPASSSTTSSSLVSAPTGSVFSFSSISPTTSSASPLVSKPAVFGIQQQTQATGFGFGSPGNDHMNVEDCMNDDSVQAPALTVPTFGQPSNSLSTSTFQFGAPATPLEGSSVFQFGNDQNSNVTQNPLPFQATGNFEFSAGGSFSLGSTGGDKSGRRIIRVKRDKQHKRQTK